MPPFECDFLELEKKLAGKKAALPVYLVSGDEPYLRLEAARLIVKRLSPKDEDELALVKVDGEGDDKTSLAEAVMDLCTPSLFSATKIVHYVRAEKALEKDGDQVLEFLKGPVDGAHLLLEVAKADRRRRWAKAVKKAGGIVKCGRLYDQPPPWSSAPRWDTPLAGWVAGEGGKAGLALSKKEAQFIIDRVGPSLFSLHEEIEKISLYLRADPGGKKKKVSAKVVDAVVGEYNEYGLFKLTDAVGNRRVDVALRIAHALFSQGMSRAGRGGVIHDEATIATVLTDRIYAKIREIYEAKVLIDEGGGVDAIVEVMKKHRVFAPRLADEAGRFGFPLLNRLLRRLAETDRALKSGGGTARLLLETLLMEVGK